MHKGFGTLPTWVLSFPKFSSKKKPAVPPKKSRWRSSCANYLFFERNNLNFRDSEMAKFRQQILRGNKVCRCFFFNRSKGSSWGEFRGWFLSSHFQRWAIADLQISRVLEVVHVYRPGNSKDEVVRKKWTYCPLLVDTLNQVYMAKNPICYPHRTTLIWSFQTISSILSLLILKVIKR